MAKSNLTEGLKAMRGQNTHLEPNALSSGAPIPQWKDSRQESKAISVPAPSPRRDGNDIVREIQSIFAQKSSSKSSWSAASYFGCSPPSRSDNGLIRDKGFGRCVPIPSPSNSSLGQPSTTPSLNLSTA